MSRAARSLRLGLLGAVVVVLASAATAGDPASEPAGRVYIASDLPALVEGLGYDSSPLPTDGVRVLVDRPSGRFEVNVVLSQNGRKLQLYMPLRLIDSVEGIPSAVLKSMLERSLTLAPTRFYVLNGTVTGAKAGSVWLGLQRSLDNRSLRPRHVRQAIDALFDGAKVTEDLWNPDRWGGGVATPPGTDKPR